MQEQAPSFPETRGKKRGTHATLGRRAKEEKKKFGDFCEQGKFLHLRVSRGIRLRGKSSAHSQPIEKKKSKLSETGPEYRSQTPIL